MMSPHLSGICGRSFLVTRPEGQALVLMDGLRALGAKAEHIPFLAIEPIDDRAAIEHITGSLSAYTACIFISANAVRVAWPVLTKAGQGWPENLAAACVGPGTANVLRELGVAHVVMPRCRFDSEGLLAEPFFEESRCHGHAFAMIRGEGGRDFLAQSLRARGARVDEAAVYQRCLHPDVLSRLQNWVDAGGGTLLVSSSESLQRVMSAAPQALRTRLQTLPILVPHSRIAECAYQLGFSDVTTSAGGDAGMLDYLRSYNVSEV